MVYLGRQNPDMVKDDGAGPLPGTVVKRVEVPYQFPKERQELTVVVQSSGDIHFRFYITPETTARK